MARWGEVASGEWQGRNHIPVCLPDRPDQPAMPPCPHTLIGIKPKAAVRAPGARLLQPWSAKHHPYGPKHYQIQIGITAIWAAANGLDEGVVILNCIDSDGGEGIYSIWMPGGMFCIEKSGTLVNEFKPDLRSVTLVAEN